MKTLFRGVSLFYGLQFVLMAVGMTLYFVLSEQPFGMEPDSSHRDLGLIILALVALPQAGMGCLLIWFGLTPENRNELLETLKKTIHWLATH